MVENAALRLDGLSSLSILVSNSIKGCEKFLTIRYPTREKSMIIRKIKL